jgi:hypothetical protein
LSVSCEGEVNLIDKLSSSSPSRFPNLQHCTRTFPKPPTHATRRTPSHRSSLERTLNPRSGGSGVERFREDLSGVGACKFRGFHVVCTRKQDQTPYVSNSWGGGPKSQSLTQGIERILTISRFPRCLHQETKLEPVRVKFLRKTLSLGDKRRASRTSSSAASGTSRPRGRTPWCWPWRSAVASTRSRASR